MTDFVKQMLNREFTEIVDYTEDGGGCGPFYDNISQYFEGAKYEGEDEGGTPRVPWPWWYEHGHPYCNEYVWDETHIKFDMIKKIERDAQLGALIVPLQIKIKAMLYSPHNRRGKAFIEKQIDWAFGRD